METTTVIVISPQSWGKMRVSKHHYAIELARMGHRVFFLNPPDYSLQQRFDIRDAPDGEGVLLVSHKPPVPYFLKFKATPLFHYFMGRHIRNLLNVLNADIGIVWSFDLGNIYPFKYFPGSAKKIFFPVDEPLNSFAFRSARGADIMFSVTREILEKYKGLGIPGHFINHGVDSRFLFNDAVEMPSAVSVGLSGNLLRPDIDRETLLQIIDSNPQVFFRIWGSYEPSSANLSGNTDAETLGFIESLKCRPNVMLEGTVTTDKLIAGYRQVSAFLICYDIEKDQSKGTNYHKIMEFLGTGRVVISNNVSTFAGRPDLLVMNKSRTDNKALPNLFAETIRRLDFHNGPDRVAARRGFAVQNTYRKQVERVQDIIKGHL